MDSRRLILVLAVGAVAIIAVIGLRSWLAGPPPPEAATEAQPRIIIAKHDIAAGTLLNPAMDLDWQVVPVENIKEDQLREGNVRLEDYNGAVARRQLRTGEPITVDAMTRAGEGGFMSAVLDPGMRAVSIAVTPISGNAGFISPGDRVDLIVTHRLRSAGTDGAILSETFIHNIRVIAVDQQIDNPDNKAILAKTVTVEVTPRQAEQVAVAEDMGKVSLALRSLTVAKPAAEGEAAAEKPAEPEMPDSTNFSATVRVIRGDQIENVTLR